MVLVVISAEWFKKAILSSKDWDKKKAKCFLLNLRLQILYLKH